MSTLGSIGEELAWWAQYVQRNISRRMEKRSREFAHERLTKVEKDSWSRVELGESQ
jgi:hypothetical protein